MKLIMIHPHPGVRDRSGSGRGVGRRERSIGEAGGREGGIDLECAEGGIEGAKQRQAKERGGSYRKELVGGGVDDGGERRGERQSFEKRPGKKRKTILYWKRILREARIDWTDVET